MGQIQDMTTRIMAAAEKARTDKATKTQEEINRDFFEVIVAEWNEDMAGDITLVDGRTVSIPKFEI